MSPARSIGADGKRRSIRLGQMPLKMADSVKVKVEALLVASVSNLPIDVDTARWVAGLDDSLASKLSAAGLVEHRRRPTLEQWLTQYIEERRGELKPSAVRKVEQTCTKLREFVPVSIRIDKITPSEAAAWRRSMRKNLSEASKRMHAGDAKTILAAAMTWKLIESNPFALLSSGRLQNRESL